MTWFAIIDKTYRRQEVETDSPIDLALVRVYTAILTFGAEVKKTRDENDAGKNEAIIRGEIEAFDNID
mgnify:CR=1 FL=1|jgi:hypothetical protein